MAKDPAMLWYASDYISGTHGMSFEEKGAYMDLLMLQFNRGHMTEHMVGQAVGQIFGQIQYKFKKDKEGLWYNERVDREKELRKSFVNSRKNNLSGKNQYSKKTGHTTSLMEDVNILSISIDEKLEKMIVKEMMAIWMKLKPRYKSEEGLDFTACLDIAYRIGAELGIDKSKIILLGNTTNLNDLLILEKWEEYINFILTDNYFNGLTLNGVANKKNWHSILNKIEYKPNEDKERLSESKRITPEQYFKN